MFSFQHMSADVCNVYTDKADISVWLQGFALLADAFIFKKNKQKTVI